MVTMVGTIITLQDWQYLCPGDEEQKQDSNPRSLASGSVFQSTALRCLDFDLKNWIEDDGFYQDAEDWKRSA